MDMPPKKKLKKRPKAGATHEAPKPLIIDEGLEHQELEFDGRKALRKKTSSMGGFHSGQRRDALPSSAALMMWYNEPLKKKYRGTFVYRRWLWPYIYKPRRNRRSVCASKYGLRFARPSQRSGDSRGGGDGAVVLQGIRHVVFAIVSDDGGQYVATAGQRVAAGRQLT